MTPSEFVAMASATGNVDLVSNKSLTHALLSMDFSSPNPDIRFLLEGMMVPDALKSHILKKGLATLIHSENVERVEIRAKDDRKVLGTVFFDVPRMVNGQFQFQALKGKGGRWRFEDFILLGTKQRVHQASDGQWTVVELSPDELERWKKVRALPSLTRE